MSYDHKYVLNLRVEIGKDLRLINIHCDNLKVGYCILYGKQRV